MNVEMEEQKRIWSKKIDDVLNELAKEKGRTTFDKVVEKLSIPASILSQLPELNRYIIEQIKASKKKGIAQQEEYSIRIEDVERAIQELNKQNETVNFLHICKHLHINPHTVRQTERIQEAISYHKEEEQKNYMKHVEVLVDQTLSEWIEKKEWISFEKIASHLEIGVSILYLTPPLKNKIEESIYLYDQYAINKVKTDSNYSRQQKKTIAKILLFIEDMINNKELVTISHLSEKMGLSRTVFYQYQEIKERMKKYEEEDKIKLVELVIQEMYKQKQIVTIDKLKKELGFGRNFFLKFPEIKIWINEANEQLRLDNFKERVDIAIEQLRIKNEKVNISQVAKEMGVSTAYLYTQERIVAYIKKERDIIKNQYE